MTSPKTKRAKAELQCLTLTRTFDAPRELVWRAWTEPEMVKRWWGPKIFEAPHVEIDLRVGGKGLFCMRSDAGDARWRQGIWSTGVYKEIVPLERFVMTDSFSDERGNVVPASRYGIEGDVPTEMLITVTFEDAPDGKTKVTLTQDGLPAGPHHEGASQGWNESFDKLAQALSSEALSFVITRVFDAPRELVWRAWTEPAMLRQWSCPDGFVATLAEGELRVGGRWRGGMKSPEHGELFVGGVYKDIKKPERLAFTHVWADAHEGQPVETLVTVELTERDGKTTMVFTHAGFDAAEVRDGHREGWGECFDKLARMLQSTR